MELVKIMVSKGFLADMTSTTILVDLLFANPGDKELQKLLQ
jgi:hypothetical protein